MGQITITERLTQTHGNPPALSQFALLDSLATTVTLHFANSHLDAGTNGAMVARLYYNSVASFSGATQQGSQTVPFDCIGTTIDFPFSTTGIPAGSYVVGFMGSNTAGNTNSVDLELWDDLTYCVYGAQRRAGSPDVVSVTYDLALAVLTYVKANLWTAVIGFLLGQLVNVPVLCSTVRPPYVQLTASDVAQLFGLGSPQEIQDAKAKLARWFLWAAWSYFCECVPGSPGPVQPPILPQPKPPYLPDDPTLTFTCDNNDLCTQLLHVNVALNAIALRLATQEQLVTLIQRQGVPFGYITGTVHAGLSAAGEFTVADILGLAIDITTLPATYPSFGGDPDTYHNLGKISVGTTEGWERSWWATHDPYLILPISGAITKVGYTFPSGIIATITELVREP